ncbi:MAG: ABC transporter permease [Bryobacterales bacterium]|nr:ABC transporter permease [Bryobacterales bacterium]
MIRYLLKRFLWMAATVLGMSLVAFFLVAFAPGDPIAAELRFLGVPSNPETIDALRREHDLDGPVIERYVRWLGRTIRLELGTSISNGRPVTEELARAAPSTLALAACALLLIVLGSLTAGVAAVLFPRGAVPRILQALTVGVVSIPLYWLALTAIVVGTLTFGFTALMDPSSPANLALAAALLALGPGLGIGRTARQRIADERLEDYVRLAAAIGHSPGQILVRDIGRVVAPSLVTMWANSFGYLLGGSVVIERIFDRPGLGSLALQAIAARDYPVLQAYLMLAGVLFVAVNWAADGVSAWADPRLRRRGIHD